MNESVGIKANEQWKMQNMKCEIKLMQLWWISINTINPVTFKRVIIFSDSDLDLWFKEEGKGLYMVWA